MNRLSLLLILLLNCALLCACQQKSGRVLAEVEQEVSVAPSKTIKHGKPGAPVNLLSASQLAVAAGSVTSVDILLGAQLGDGSMHVELNPGDGLQLRGQGSAYDFTHSEDGQYHIKADIYAASNGRYYLNVNTTINTQGAAQFRSLAIIVVVGVDLDAAASAPKMLKNSADENLISLPAQEQIINQ